MNVEIICIHIFSSAEIGTVLVMLMVINVTRLASVHSEMIYSFLSKMLQLRRKNCNDSVSNLKGHRAEEKQSSSAKLLDYL